MVPVAIASTSPGGPPRPQVSWNIDCLSPAHKIARVYEVCSIILADDEALPDALLFQVRCTALEGVASSRVHVPGPVAMSRPGR